MMMVPSEEHYRGLYPLLCKQCCFSCDPSNSCLPRRFWTTKGKAGRHANLSR